MTETLVRDPLCVCGHVRSVHNARGVCFDILDDERAHMSPLLFRCPCREFRPDE